MASHKDCSSSPVILKEDELKAVVKIFKALSSATRLRIICTLTSKESLCVSDIARTAGASITNASHHLNLLEHLGFVTQDRRGKEVYYSLSDECIEDIVRRASDHVSGS